jgi:hypothetical protein
MNEEHFKPISAEEVTRSQRKKRECDHVGQTVNVKRNFTRKASHQKRIKTMQIKKEQRNLNKSIGGKC